MSNVFSQKWEIRLSINDSCYLLARLILSQWLPNSPASPLIALTTPKGQMYTVVGMNLKPTAALSIWESGNNLEFPP